MAQDPEDDNLSPEEEEGGPVKPFLEHLEDLRWVLIKCGVALVVGMSVCLGGAPFIVKFLKWPLLNSGTNPQISSFGPVAPVVVAMKIALYGGITLSLPFILYFIADFVMPALKAIEKVYFRRAFIVGAGLFLLGMMICYFWVLPISIRGMVQFTEWMGLDADVWRVDEYFQFVIMFMFGMGLSFELPVLILTLVRIGILEHEHLIKGRKYFFVGNLVLCAFITPDFLSTFLMVIPVQILMEICIMISAYWERKKKASEAALVHGRHHPSSAD